MPVTLMLPLGMSMALLAWLLVFRWYLDPLFRRMPLEQALIPLLLPHCFRYLGLMFLVPGVTAEPLDPRFALPAAYGDLVAAALAFVAVGLLRFQRPGALATVWVFNLWGSADLLNAVARGLAYTPDGALGAAYWIPALFVPLLLASHVYVFVLLLRAARWAGRWPGLPAGP